MTKDQAKQRIESIKKQIDVKKRSMEDTKKQFAKAKESRQRAVKTASSPTTKLSAKKYLADTVRNFNAQLVSKKCELDKLKAEIQKVRADVK